MHDDETFEETLPALTRDLELRPRGITPAGLDRLIQPRLAGYLEQIETTLVELRKLAEQAPGVMAEAAIKTKIADTLLRLIKVGEQACAAVGTQPRTQLRSQADLPDLDSFPPAAREKFIEGMAIVERERSGDCSYWDKLKEDSDDTTPF